tara:strand:+ start:2828 stop:3028 length:201 start_codon:yes stop_codon:yes gene_type:complete
LDQAETGRLVVWPLDDPTDDDHAKIQQPLGSSQPISTELAANTSTSQTQPSIGTGSGEINAADVSI